MFEKLLKQISYTKLMLLSNVACPNGVGDFHSMGYCTVIYKCIAKLIGI